MFRVQRDETPPGIEVEAALQRQTAETLEQVKRKVQEGLMQQQSPGQGDSAPEQPK